LIGTLGLVADFNSALKDDFGESLGADSFAGATVLGFAEAIALTGALAIGAFETGADLTGAFAVGAFAGGALEGGAFTTEVFEEPDFTVCVLVVLFA